MRLLLIGGFLDAPYVDVQGAVERALAGKRRRLREFVRTQTVEWSGADSLVRWFHDQKDFEPIRDVLPPAGM